jgi:signal transduction histidine kinase
MNLLANAIDALEEASSERSFAEIQNKPNQITIRTAEINNQIKIEILDNGGGIPDTLKNRLSNTCLPQKM